MIITLGAVGAASLSGPTVDARASGSIAVEHADVPALLAAPSQATARAQRAIAGRA